MSPYCTHPDHFSPDRARMLAHPCPERPDEPGCTEPGCKRARARGLLLCQPHVDALVRHAFEIDESADYAELERRYAYGDR